MMDIQKLTKQQAIIITGFTGILCGEMSDFHADVEKRLGRGVQTFEFGIKSFMDELKGIYHDDFTKIATVEPEIQTQKASALEKEHEAFEAEFAKTNFYKGMVESLKNEDCPLTSVFEIRNGEYRSTYVKLSFDMWKAAKAQVPEGVNHKGGYYIQDLRNPIGNCMKFWYRSGYGTKHAKLFWCETLEEAKKYQGGCDWFKIWYAPYIDSLVEYTVDMQLADRQREKLMIEAAQGEKE